MPILKPYEPKAHEIKYLPPQSEQTVAPPVKLKKIEGSIDLFDDKPRVRKVKP